jgi:hypothetical protein
VRSICLLDHTIAGMFLPVAPLYPVYKLPSAILHNVRDEITRIEFTSSFSFLFYLKILNLQNRPRKMISMSFDSVYSSSLVCFPFHLSSPTHCHSHSSSTGTDNAESVQIIIPASQVRYAPSCLLSVVRTALCEAVRYTPCLNGYERSVCSLKFHVAALRCPPFFFSSPFVCMTNYDLNSAFSAGETHTV